MRFAHTISTFKAWCRLVDNGEHLWRQEMQRKIRLTGGGLIVMVVLAAAFKIASVVCLLWLVVATLRLLGVNI